ncbi:carcinine transporter isoform X2 [Parasteatoda tepidariorum]|uniref:carcinine transporter isoform X2 n=1 Tax=Parasteatoda tepidariorum TaxID=114398 RepID=UPI001C71EE85|nr:carcinine transporter isoform X2 [Parasteatoda tepidariorum]
MSFTYAGNDLLRAPSLSKEMDFEDILKDVGGFGMYQKILVFAFLIPSFIVVPWFSMNSIFISSTPDHWCYVPELASSNLSFETQQYLIRPPSDRKCLRYDVDYSYILRTGNITVDQNWPTKKCDQGWQYDTTDYDATSVTRWDMVCGNAHYASLVLSLVFIGDVIGTPLYGFMSDKWGRKPTFLCLALVVAVTEIGSVLSPFFGLFLFLRGVNGTTMSTIYTTGFIILLELVSPGIRARMNGISTTSWTMGLCLLPLVAYLTRNWIHLSIVTSTAALCLLVYWKVLPESPSWLISREKYEEAAEIMGKISKMNGKTAHEGNQLLQKIQKLGEKKKLQANGEVNSPKDFFRYPTLRKRFLLVTLCWIGNSIPYFGLQMNVKNLAGNQFFNFFLVSLVEVPAHFSTWLFMERIGRRWCSVCAFALSTFSCMLPVILPEEDYPNIGVIASLLAKVGTSSAFMTLYQQGPELFPTSLRGIGMGMACTIGTGSTLVVPYIVYLVEYGKFIPFLAFSIITCFSGICSSFLPETLNKKLPQTVDDAENFATNETFFSCGSQDSDESPNLSPKMEEKWSSRTLSVADLACDNSGGIIVKRITEKRDSVSASIDLSSLENNLKEDTK